MTRSQLQEQRKLHREALQRVGQAWLEEKFPHHASRMSLRVEFRRKFTYRVRNTGTGARIVLVVDPSRLDNRSFPELLRTAAYHAKPMVTSSTHAVAVEHAAPA